MYLNNVIITYAVLPQPVSSDGAEKRHTEESKLFWMGSSGIETASISPQQLDSDGLDKGQFHSNEL